MVKKTSRQTTKKTTKNSAKKQLKSWLPAPRSTSTMNDVKSAILLVSLIINLAVFIGWLALRVTTVYDAQVYGLLFNR